MQKEVVILEFKLQEFNTPLSVLRLANVHYFEFTSQYQTPNNSHDFCEMLYVDNGKISVHAENYSGVLSDNQLIIHRPNEKHSLKCIDNICPNIIIIGFECLSENLEVFSRSPVTLQANHKKMLSEIMKEGMNVYAPPYDIPNTLEMKKRENYLFGADQMLKINLEAFLITIMRDYQHLNTLSKNNTMPDNKISDILKYIKEHYSENISLDNICFLFGTNKTTLCRNFKNECGTTILNYINQLKIKDAKRCLREQKLSITEISENLGFSSIHYFCRLFKKHTGLSPKEYKKTIKSHLNL